jgi:hypothetical protein
MPDAGWQVRKTPKRGAEKWKYWREHFRRQLSREDHLPWNDAYRLSEAERETIRSSIQQFQLGEGSRGRRLVRRAYAFGRAERNRDFVRAVRLFVKEEQRHSGYLLRFMRAQGIAELRRHWVDTVFRVLRGLAGLEVSLRVLVTAEIIAIPYYRALSQATKSPLLRAISEQILDEEAEHLRYQGSMLEQLGARRGPAVERAVRWAQRVFLTCVALVVWHEHRAVFAAAGYSSRRFELEADAELLGVELASARGAEGTGKATETGPRMEHEGA